MSHNVDKINRWRMEQFHRNNQESNGSSSDIDYVSLSPSKHEFNAKDPSTVFLSDSDEEITAVRKRKTGSAVPASPIAKSSDNKTRAERKRKRRTPDIEVTQLSSDSENDRDSDADFVVEKPKRKRATVKQPSNPVRKLPLKPISASRKTAVVVPITKSQSQASQPDVNLIDDSPKAGCSKVLPDKSRVNDNYIDPLSPVSKEQAKSKTASSAQEQSHHDLESLKLIPQKGPSTPEKTCMKVEQTTPTTGIKKLDLLDDLLNSPLPRTPAKKLSEGNSPMQISRGTPKTTKIVRPQVHKKDNEIINLNDSDSDISLFEVSINESKASTALNKETAVSAVSDKFLHNPPPSPVEASDDLPGVLSLPTIEPTQPRENGFSSDSSHSSYEHDIAKRRLRKGKQPANKRKKVVAKRSKPLSESENENNDSIQIVSPITANDHDADDRMSQNASMEDNRGRPTVTVPKAANTNLIEDVESDGVPSASNLPKNEASTANTAVVRPSDSVILINDDDEDDDIVMLTSNERSQQEEDDMEFARRLQAQFDEENAARPTFAPTHHSATSHSAQSLDDSIVSLTAPLSDGSERLLQAIGGSPAVSRLLGSPSVSGEGHRHMELDQVQQRLDLLQQLALQQEYLDDSTISEILGVPAPPSPHVPSSSTSSGPRPPGSSRTSRRGGARATGRRGRNNRADSPVAHQEQGMFGRVLSFFGMNDSEMDYESLLDLQERIGDVRQAGISQSDIDRLPSRTYEESASNTDSTCHICMSDFEAGQRVRNLSCFHEYHAHCIDQWLQRNASCPVCRAQVSVD